jgi:hypothetical protein
MPSEAAREAAIKHRHLVEKIQHEARSKAEEETLRADLHNGHQAAVKSAMADHEAKARQGFKSAVKVPTDDEHLSERLSKINKLKDKHEIARQAMAGRQEKEAAAELSKPALPTTGMPPAEPQQGDPLHGIWHKATPLQRRSWHETTMKYHRRRADLDEKQAAAREKNSRYPSAAKGRHERDVDEHLRLNQAERAEKLGLRDEIMTDQGRQERTQREGQIASRA